ncbi:multiple sugar transport system permease protein [Paenibacillus endophyticus]|uniref:Multiple sugar transport system permease protein n=1 Tax=Paenibacillus endophyticus TaxID=1294268 RepID=A0A7W5C473_9BACL|nr:sugar ABC transporter permease [Paenibacillus endophyticus]MBB3150344.1 multiple sugar transport system permease protein [Paenibacillus endophyticus]
MNTQLAPSLERPKSKATAIRAKWNRFWREMRRDAFVYLFLAPFLICFLLFIVIPVIMAATLGFTSYDGFGSLHFIGLANYISLFTQDIIFLTKAIPNTFLFALIVGPGGYILAFVFAWLIHQLPIRIRDYYTLAFYAPSMAGGVALSVVWIAAFSGDRVGYFNNFLLGMGWIDSPVIWLQDPKYLLNIMIIVSLWVSFSVGFLAMLAGLQTVNRELYEAGRIDGISSRLQEVFYITIPSMKPQMLFSAVMSIVGTLKAGGISTQLTGMAITPSYSGHLIINHIDDYAFIRFELGYASAVSVMLLIFSYFAMRFAYRLFGSKEEL